MTLVSPQTLAFIKKWEGCRLTAYHGDADPDGLWTIGYGTTRLNGKPVHQGQTITQAQADEILKQQVADRQAAVEKLVKVPLTENQKTALVSFAYNEGVSAFAISTLLKKLNKKDYSGAADQFPAWIYANHKIVPGLINRRAAEKALFMKP